MTQVLLTEQASETVLSECNIGSKFLLYFERKNAGSFRGKCNLFPIHSTDYRVITKEQKLKLY